MTIVLRPHRPEIVIDDETWAALEAKAAERGETTEDVIVYAIELYLEREGFSPAWAQEPTDVAFPGRASRRPISDARGRPRRPAPPSR